MAMKWALIYTMQAEHSVVEVDDLARGVLVGTYLLETARLLPGHVSKTRTARVEVKIVEALERVRGQWLLGSDLHRLVGGRIKAAELKASLSALVRLGVVEEAPSPSGRSSVYRIPVAVSEL